ncbi:DUF1295 domain-containing protein [candidate division KSB1 bacterium]|nr:DUF1295 domain-containing protein [candidate division KSB1 bacterium]NIR69883.1 DUF1295 domain-containing protein [candidate division KSB1 bacterium]NIS28036.1 DUF1295 domain-containing protein [candidate division KSB1 bacterium]NIT74907.1 DUF1295 domain-containing protein [candidate division KSB1 bacterium]NIU28691.1 DUF1295 domain-containing protein [candidate division KSB1 bacterium]
MIAAMVATAFASVSLVMFVLWLVHLRIKNAGIVDIGWAGNFALIAIIYYLMGGGYETRKLLIAAMALLWSLRLTGYLFVRVVGHEEEGRYRQLRREWRGKNVDLRFLFFFLFQGVLNVVLALPLLLACVNPEPHLSIFEFVGFGLWAVALLGESLADRQLQKFKANPANKGKVCRVGLWKYSRHPNYFFEWLIWVAFFVFALPSPFGLTALVSPLLMSYFLFKVTGIPATEEQSLRSKGEAYREYQRSTSMFVPWFPKKSAETSQVKS